jgi:hypothetical protein
MSELLGIALVFGVLATVVSTLFKGALKVIALALLVALALVALGGTSITDSIGDITANLFGRDLTPEETTPGPEAQPFGTDQGTPGTGDSQFLDEASPGTAAPGTTGGASRTSPDSGTVRDGGRVRPYTGARRPVTARW